MDKQQVTLKIKSSQIVDKGEPQSMELFSVESMYKKGDTTYVTYDESEISGLEGTTTVLKISDQIVKIIRQGSVTSNQEFIKGAIHNFQYRTPYGIFHMTSKTRNLEIKAENNTIIIDIEFNLDMGGLGNSQNTLSIVIK